MKRKPARKPAKPNRMPTVRDIPPEILKGFQEVPAWVQSTAADQQKILAFVFRVANMVARVDRDFKVLEQRRENGQILAEEGRAARRPKTDRRADRVCKLYRQIRPTYPAGRRGNGAALEAVSRRFGTLPGREKPISKPAIRKILKRCGVPCR